jgi:hypothetical protein
MSNDMKDNTCFSGKFKRLNYYEGMLLTEQDFKAEQKYFREKMKLHNRLHGYGVVWGLEITKRCIKEGATSAEKFFIEPGFALDCAGNEIVVCHPYKISVDEKIEELLQVCKPVKEKPCLLISLKYCERESEPQAQYASACAEDELQVKMSRICEGYSVELIPNEEMDEWCKQHSDYHDGKIYRQDCPGVKDCCESEDGIILGCICIVPEKKVECDDDQYGATGATEAKEPRRDADKMSIASGSYKVFIDPCCKPPRVCRPCATPQQRWEYHKQQLLQAVCRESESFDLTCLIGKKVSEAEDCLNKQEVSWTCCSITEFQHDLLSKLHNATSCANPGSQVILIVDDTGEYEKTKKKEGCDIEGCILFAFSIPSQ